MMVTGSIFPPGRLANQMVSNKISLSLDLFNLFEGGAFLVNGS